jgi:hypothetical protein
MITDDPNLRRRLLRRVGVWRGRRIVVWDDTFTWPQRYGLNWPQPTTLGEPDRDGPP